MDKKKTHNKELIAELDKTFADLSKEIGNNRQQLTAKVTSVQLGLRKELAKSEVTPEREKEIRNEVLRTVKMAHQQLPHLSAPRPVPNVPKKKK